MALPQARRLAIEFNVPIVPGTEASVSSAAEAKAFIDTIGYPVICKATKACTPFL